MESRAGGPGGGIGRTFPTGWPWCQSGWAAGAGRPGGGLPVSSGPEKRWKHPWASWRGWSCLRSAETAGSILSPDDLEKACPLLVMFLLKRNENNLPGGWFQVLPFLGRSFGWPAPRQPGAGPRGESEDRSGGLLAAGCDPGNQNAGSSRNLVVMIWNW